MLKVYLFHRNASCLHIFMVNCLTFWYIICRNVKLLHVYLFHGHASCLLFHGILYFSGTLYVGTSNCFMTSYFTINYVNFWYIICNNIQVLYVFLFHRHVYCIPYSKYTILRSGTLYVGAPYCVMSTYFIDMRIVDPFHDMKFYFQVHYM